MINSSQISTKKFCKNRNRGVEIGVGVPTPKSFIVPIN